MGEWERTEAKREHDVSYIPRMLDRIAPYGRDGAKEFSAICKWIANTLDEARSTRDRCRKNHSRYGLPDALAVLQNQGDLLTQKELDEMIAGGDLIDPYAEK